MTKPMRKHIVTLMAGLLFCSAAPAVVMPNLTRNRQAEADRWADSVYASLSERQRIAQLIFPKVVPTQGDASKATIRRLIQREAAAACSLPKALLPTISKWPRMPSRWPKCRCL